MTYDIKTKNQIAPKISYFYELKLLPLLYLPCNSAHSFLCSWFKTESTSVSSLTLNLVYYFWIDPKCWLIQLLLRSSKVGNFRALLLQGLLIFHTFLWTSAFSKSVLLSPRLEI